MSIPWRIPSASIHQLLMRGYAIVDKALPHETALALRDEIVASAMSPTTIRYLTPNSTVVVPPADVATTKRLLVRKHNIGEFDLSRADVSAALPKLAQFAHDSSLLTLLSQSRLYRLDSQSVKAQINFGNGGCFPIHTDTASHLDKRIITAVCYLNDQYNQAKDGGQLRLYPFPRPPVVVAPLFNRVVLFSSSQMLHRVLPSTIDRLCFTIWLTGESLGNTSKEAEGFAVNANEAEDSASRKRLLQPKTRYLLGKLVYAREWEESIMQSHPDIPERQVLIAAHRRDIELIENALKEHLPMNWKEFEGKNWEDYFARFLTVNWF
ncbi:2OG-Fe(II) oxygenase superfamily-domain-containing protein [Chytriomyces sp. MP71]|nr:2OG-Fe(II) oxygenase superfamily-domain-containing protein [Chytriomyces sp. MP71]